tara:strand:- start:137 stop:535 length:399 start_codon:yes stop_codon:yes gene_type:complete
MKVYVIVSITAEGNLIPSYSVEPLGIYSTLEEALDYSGQLEENTPKSSSIETVYDVFEFTLGEEPTLLKFLKAQQKMVEESVQESIITLMKKGYVDQLIGEDGHFYYTLTDFGKDQMKSIPEQIKKFFKGKG